ncbi:MAG TPA: hypothetical protein VFW45_02770 [Candidatus Polarisedimenticolia bacterium]|nr:hypothetical protein [Candidatus Polarisedimenticolia bacterium]
MNRQKIRTAIVASAFALGLAANASAAQLVTFTRGHSIVVQTVEKRGNWYYFTLDGGGEMGVPVKQVASLEEYDLPPAAAAPDAAAQQPPRVTAVPNPPPSAPDAAPAPAALQSNPGDAPAQQDPNAVDPTAGGQHPGDVGNAAPNGSEDWRSKVKMNVGGRSQQLAPGRRQGAGMGGYGAVNPFSRKNKPPQQPVPPQQ